MPANNNRLMHLMRRQMALLRIPFAGCVYLSGDRCSQAAAAPERCAGAEGRDGSWCSSRAPSPAMNNEEIIQEVLQGHLTSPKWPTPRLVKIFIASTRSDFAEERRQLLEVVGPELQSKYDHIGLEVELVDMHFGAEVDPALDAPLFEDHQHEVRECHRVSRGCFFLCLVGNKYGPCPLPARLDGDAYEALYATAVDMGLKAGLLDTWFGRNDSAYVLQQPSDVTTPEWRATCQEVAGVVGTAARRLAEAELRTPPARFRHLTYSAVERHFSQALGLLFSFVPESAA